MEGYFCSGGGILLEHSVFLPLCLILLLDCHEGIPLVCALQFERHDCGVRMLQEKPRRWRGE